MKKKRLYCIVHCLCWDDSCIKQTSVQSTCLWLYIQSINESTRLALYLATFRKGTIQCLEIFQENYFI